MGGAEGSAGLSTRAYRGKLEWLELCTAPLLGGGGVGIGAGAGGMAMPAVVGAVGGGEDAEEGTSMQMGDGAGGGGGGGGGGRWEGLSCLLASDSGFDLSEHSCGLICANALNTRRVVYDLPNRRLALLLEGDDLPSTGGLM